MNKISVNKLLENAVRGGVSRKVYIEKTVRQMIDTPLRDMYSRINPEKTKRDYSYRDAEVILAKFIIAPEAVQCFRYSDLMFLVQCCLESEDIDLYELALETVDSFIEWVYGVDKVRTERRLPEC